MLKRVLFFIIFSFIVITSFFLKTTNAGGGPTPGPWQASTPFSNSAFSHPLPSFAAKGYYYVLLNNRDIMYAKINSDGSLGTWNRAIALHNEGSGRGYTAVVVNDTPYLLRFGNVERLDIDPQTGTVTGITQVGSSTDDNDSVGGNYYYWNTAVLADFGTQKYVYNLGGFDCCESPHYSNNNKIYRASNLTSNNWQWEYMGDGPYQNPYKAAFYKVPNQDYGYIFTSDLNPSDKPLYIRKVRSDGSFEGNWEQIRLPQSDGENLGDFFVVSDALFVIRGSKVYSLPNLTENLSNASWSGHYPNDLPEGQVDRNWQPSLGTDHADGASYAVIGNMVYLTGPRKVYYSTITQGTSATVTNTPPIPTNTLIPPTATPTPLPRCTQTPNSGIKLIFQPDHVRNVEKFKTAGGLKYKAINTDQHCYVSGDNVEIEYNSTNEGDDFYTKSALAFPDGHYEIYLWGPRNIKQKFSGITLSASLTEPVDCTLDTQSASCGDFGDPAARAEKKLLSGDANRDNIINLLDFEILRQNIGRDGNNPADFDYNERVRSIDDGDINDFDLLKANFGKIGVAVPN